MRLEILAVPLLMTIIAVPARSDDKIAAVISGTAPSAGDHIRQLAFDGSPDTYFETPSAAASDDLTLRFAQPVTIQSLKITTGTPEGNAKLDAGNLQISHDGQTFQDAAPFADGVATLEQIAKPVQGLRIRPSGDGAHPLAVREIAVVSDPPVATFRVPVEFTVDTTDAPEMNDWAEETARLCEAWYPKLSDMLASDGYTPPKRITMTLKSDYNGVAEAGGNRIKGSVKYFKAHPDDKGAMIHETVHVIQRYRSRNNPSWLVEGVADYIRFFQFEPGKIGPIGGRRARYNASYRTTAAFLAYVTEKYDKDLVSKLNAAMRQGKYKEDLFKDFTGKTVQDLDEEWRATLNR